MPIPSTQSVLSSIEEGNRDRQGRRDYGTYRHEAQSWCWCGDADVIGSAIVLDLSQIFDAESAQLIVRANGRSHEARVRGAVR
jgi:hypothetical protein